MTKTSVFKYSLGLLVLITSIYSYIFLNRQSDMLSSELESPVDNKERTVILRDKDNRPTKIVVIAPPKQKNHAQSSNSNNHSKPTTAKGKSSLPDVEFLKFMIRKGKEGIPVLEFRDFCIF